MKVRELIDMLSDQPPDAEVELVVVAPVDDDDPAITVDRYSVEAMLPWVDDDIDDEDGLTVWLIGGEDADVDALIDQLEQDAEASGGFEL